MMSTDLLTKTEERASPTVSHRALTRLDISGMTCGNCARHVTEAIQSVVGVDNAQVSLDSHHATVRWQPNSSPNAPAVIKAVEAEGFGAKLVDAASEDAGEEKLSGWRLNLALGIPATAILMLGEWALNLGEVRWFSWCAFGLATMVQIFAGARFYRGAWNQLKRGSSNMDTLVALGSTTAYGYSVWALFLQHPAHLYFMEAAAIITLISLGHWVESRVSVRASSALRNLMNLTPAVARRRLSDGRETEVSVAELQIGDQVILRPGERVPTDGRVLEGESVVDESMLTGESVPVEKSAAGLLYAGTVNLSGRLIMQVTATGEETALAHIIAAVQRAQNSRANIQRLGDKVSSVFVPVVVAVALMAGLWWGLAPGSARSIHDWLAQYLWLPPVPEGTLTAGFLIAAGVLIIACPCAMGLATPVAIMAGSDVAAQRGILIRDGVALEKAGRITAVAFDKTGTLTFGKPAVVKAWTAAVPAMNTTADLAAALARHSLHPISQAIAKTSSADLDFADWREVHGAGVEGRLAQSPKSKVQSLKSARGENAPDESAHCTHAPPHLPYGHPLPLGGREGRGEGEPRVQGEGNGDVDIEEASRLGSLRWLKESGVNLAAGEVFITEWVGQGATIVGLAQGPELLSLFAVKDTVKPGARMVVSELQRQGLKTYLVTGDHVLTAKKIAEEAGIPAENVYAEVRPEEKATLVRKLQERGERVGFVGDGINDAPALEQSDLGIAVSRASDIAREAADIILLRSEIESVPESLGLARATLRTIKQNLFWAFFYNAIGIPLAALGFMSPILCAAAMGLSDLVVIGNALRLRGWRL